MRLFKREQFDTETGLHNFRARMYDTTTATFYAVDPMRQTHSPYGYALNNPVKYTDPTGMKSPEEAAAWEAYQAMLNQSYLMSDLSFAGSGGGMVDAKGDPMGRWEEWDDFLSAPDLLSPNTIQIIPVLVYIPSAQSQSNPLSIVAALTGQNPSLTEVIFLENTRQRRDGLNALVLVVRDGAVVGRYNGSTYPNQRESDESGPPRTLRSGMHFFNNAKGHRGGQGLNIVSDINDRARKRYVDGFEADGTQNNRMYNVNIHTGPGSTGCPTIAGSQWANFSSHFDWSRGATGNSTGIVWITSRLRKYGCLASVPGRRCGASAISVRPFWFL